MNNHARREENHPRSVDNRVLGEEAEQAYSTMFGETPRLSPFEQVPPGAQGQGWWTGELASRGYRNWRGSGGQAAVTAIGRQANFSTRLLIPVNLGS